LEKSSLSRCLYFKEGTFYLAQLITKLHKTSSKAKEGIVLINLSISKMVFLNNLLFLVFCQSLANAEELTEDSGDPSTNYVFDLPDLVANYPTHGEEVQLEAFGAREVRQDCHLMKFNGGIQQLLSRKDMSDKSDK